MVNIFTKDVLDEFLTNAPELKKYMKKATMELEPTSNPPFESLVRTIIYQQLAYKAATTIHNRFLALVGELTPQSILSKSPEELRGVGLSRQKSSYVQNVANAFDKGDFCTIIGKLSPYNLYPLMKF